MLAAESDANCKKERPRLPDRPRRPGSREVACSGSDDTDGASAST